MEDVGQRVRWKPAPILAQEGPALSPFMGVPMEVEEESATLAQVDGAMGGDAAAYPTGAAAE